ncbi:hypothetical protein HDK90DRAFT_480822 [Phyllosticta capitalensis]|uniref:Secreted protein n=1 Tax=Phyllosticta capitalensis TaxID=121624 RepID=A0ABR1YX92_9PEZI
MGLSLGPFFFSPAVADWLKTDILVQATAVVMEIDQCIVNQQRGPTVKKHRSHGDFRHHFSKSELRSCSLDCCLILVPHFPKYQVAQRLLMCEQIEWRKIATQTPLHLPTTTHNPHLATYHTTDRSPLGLARNRATQTQK